MSDETPLPPIRFEALTSQQRAGMTRRFWDQLPHETQAALVDPFCSEGDGKRRVYGSPYCAEHIAAHQSEWRHAAE